MSRNIQLTYITYVGIIIFTKISLQDNFPGLLIFSKVNLNESFVTLFEIENLETCQRNCVDRQKCVALNYHTQFPYECSLNSEDDVDLEDRFGWVHQARSEILFQSPCNNCNHNQTCDRTTESCVYRECEPIIDTEDYIRLGNGNRIASRAVLACTSHMYPEVFDQLDAWPTVGICQRNGQWSFTWRPKCAEYESVCHQYHVGPEIKTKMAHWSNTIQGDIMLVSGQCGVNDSMMTSSSAFENTYLAHWAKFDFEQDTWVSEAGDLNPYLQVNFNRVTEVKGVKIRGRRTYPNYDQYATLFNVTYSSVCSQHTFESYVRNETGGSNFAGNVDSNNTVVYMFEPPINALCVRVNILDYFTNYDSSPNYFGMKLDLFGTAILPVL